MEKKESSERGKKVQRKTRKTGGRGMGKIGGGGDKSKNPKEIVRKPQ